MTPKQVFNNQRDHAYDRDILWNLSYAEWLEMWLVSGQWLNRGRAANQYQMCRYLDEGAYSVNNCCIQTGAQNQIDRHTVPVGETREIKIDWATGLYTQQDIATRYGLSQSAISKIINGKRRASYV